MEIGFSSRLQKIFEGEVVALEPQFRRDMPPSLRVVSVRTAPDTAEALPAVTADAFMDEVLGAEARHRLRQLLRAAGGLRVGSAFTAASGAAFTRFVGAHAPCVGTSCADTMATPYYLEAPSGARAPGYTTVDLLLDWTHAYRRWSLGAYLQLRNALNAPNAVVYAGSVDLCQTPAPPTLVQAQHGVCDRYMRSVPRLPLAGVRVSF